MTRQAFPASRGRQIVRHQAEPRAGAAHPAREDDRAKAGCAPRKWLSINELHWTLEQARNVAE